MKAQCSGNASLEIATDGSRTVVWGGAPSQQQQRSRRVRNLPGRPLEDVWVVRRCHPVAASEPEAPLPIITQPLGSKHSTSSCAQLAAVGCGR
eukprot:1066534-Prorocentrum_minimum.AAC.1